MQLLLLQLQEWKGCMSMSIHDHVIQILAKGHNVTYRSVISVEQTRAAKNVINEHVSENRAAREVGESQKLDSAPFVQNE
jgi:hypothetical protein